MNAGHAWKWLVFWGAVFPGGAISAFASQTLPAAAATNFLSAASGQPVATMALPQTISSGKTLADLQLMDGRHLRFDPETTADLRQLVAQLAAPIRQSRSVPANATLREQSTLKQYRRGLQEIKRLAEALIAQPAGAEQPEQVTWLRETVAALDNNWRPRVPEKIEGVTVPWIFLKQLQRPIGRGDSPATDLAPGGPADSSRRDPEPSLFWKRPANIADEDLYHGFGRTHWLDLGQTIGTYLRAKDSFGTNPGFEIACGDDEVKLKFAEVSSEPFTTRIFAALGFHADPTDYAPLAKVRYDRRIFTEFHSRQKLETRFTVFGALSLYTMSLQKHYDPFRYIQFAVLRDGRRWTGMELKARLLKNLSAAHPEETTNNFRPEVEGQIDYLITVPANAQVKDPALKNIGPWDYDQLDHPGRRELRGAGLLAAWLGFFDTRFDNTKLRLRDASSGPQLEGYFSDLGGGLGQTSGVLFQHGELPNAFPWTFTRPPLAPGPHQLARPLRITGFKPIAPTGAFAAMTVADARWMARLIGQLSERQITAALIAAGYDSATARLYEEKLVNRRDAMMADLGLGREFPPLRPGGIRREFSYDPVTEGALRLILPDGKEITAPINENSILAGKLAKRR